MFLRVSFLGPHDLRNYSRRFKLLNPIYKVFPHIDVGEQTLGTVYLTYGCLILQKEGERKSIIFGFLDKWTVSQEQEDDT